jgi:hypothetical protein
MSSGDDVDVIQVATWSLASDCRASAARGSYRR